jgi:hypothetical protein
MSAEIMNIPLGRFEDPVWIALRTYQQMSNNAFSFDADKACKLSLTPEKPNSARSVTETLFKKEKIGTLYTIAFKPGDGTGDESGYKLTNLNIDDNYPKKTLVIPRNKTGIYEEGHLTILKYNTENVHSEPKLFAGTFDLLGLKEGKVTKIGELGHPSGKDDANPLATLTCGYKDEKRFGDPHAVYSGVTGAIQVCAFLAISNEVNNRYQNLLDILNPRLPAKTE